MPRMPSLLRSRPVEGRGDSAPASRAELSLGVLAAVFVAVSLSRPWWASTSWSGAAGAAVTAAVCAGLLLVSMRLRALTLAAFTAIALLTAFWAKWVAGSEPLKIYFIKVRFDNDRAIMVTGAFALAFAVGWVIAHLVGRRRSPDRSSIDDLGRPAGWMPPLALLVITALALSALRVLVAEVWQVGVPGKVPHGLDVPGLKTVIYYACTYGPLACTSLILLSRRTSTLVRWSAAGLVLLAYAAAGGIIGSRGATINAALVLVFVALAGPRSGRARLTAKQVLAFVAAAAAVVVSLSLALSLRSVGASSAGPLGIFSFLEDRIGGLDFLSVAVTGVDRYGSSLSYIDTTTWVEFLTFKVYAYPPEAVTGVASTLPGAAFGVAGWLAVALVGVVTGLLIAVADTKYARSTDAAGRTWYLGILLAWMNLLLEGTLYPTLLILVSFGCVYALLVAVGRRRNAVSDDGEHDPDPDLDLDLELTR